MKSKIIISFTILFLTLNSSCQSTKNLNIKSLQSDLIDFLVSKGEINQNQLSRIRQNESKIHIIGVLNGYSENKLKDGVYCFSASISHTRTYYLIVENETYSILDLSSRQGLENSLKSIFDFCERKKYCSDITEEYSKRIIGIYYRINKNPSAGIDVNCESGVKETKDLP